MIHWMQIREGCAPGDAIADLYNNAFKQFDADCEISDELQVPVHIAEQKILDAKAGNPYHKFPNVVSSGILYLTSWETTESCVCAYVFNGGGFIVTISEKKRVLETA